MYTARTEAGLTIEQAAMLARSLLSPDLSWGPGRETIRRLEDGPSTEDSVEVPFLMALAKVYRVPLEDLSGLAYERAQMLVRLGIALGID